MAKKKPTPGPVATDPQNHAENAAATQGDPKSVSAAENAADAKPEVTAPDSVKLQKRLKRIEKANRLVMELNSEVAERDSEVKAAKGRLTAAQEDRDAAVVELSRIIADSKAGQEPLFEMDDDPEPAPQATGPAENWPIAELGAKRLPAIVGGAVIHACKQRDEPIGLSDTQLDKLEAAEIRTILDLERHMRDVRDWWTVLAKSQDADLVRRVVDSLREFRVVHPHGEQPQTVVEKLAEANQAAAEIPDTAGTLADAAPAGEAA